MCNVFLRTDGLVPGGKGHGNEFEGADALFWFAEVL